MPRLKGENITLRPLESKDLQFLYNCENNEKNWKISGTTTPFSLEILKDYISNAQQDIFEANQYRFVIQTESEAIGLIDLFDFDAQNKRAGVGILVLDHMQKKGIATEALALLINYCFVHLNLHQLYANILTHNTASIRLFEKFNFTKIGVKKDWIYYDRKFYDQATYQLIYTN